MDTFQSIKLWSLSFAIPTCACLLGFGEPTAFGQTTGFPKRGTDQFPSAPASEDPSNARQRADQYAQISQEVDLIELGAVKNPYVRKSIDKDRELVFAA